MFLYDYTLYDYTLPAASCNILLQVISVHAAPSVTINTSAIQPVSMD